MKNAFPFPLPADALDEFRYPGAWHELHEAMRCEDEILAGNGYLAMRCRKGAWIDAEFPPASPRFLARFEKLPWARVAKLPDTWRMLRDGMRHGKGEHGLWLKGRLAPSPVWRVGEVRVRLSLLELVARLPRAEVFTGRANADEPLWFRFSGGIGAIAYDRRLTCSSYDLFAPQYDTFTGERVERSKTQFAGFRPSGTMKNWPPADTSDV